MWIRLILRWISLDNRELSKKWLHFIWKIIGFCPGIRINVIPYIIKWMITISIWIAMYIANKMMSFLLSQWKFKKCYWAPFVSLPVEIRIFLKLCRYFISSKFSVFFHMYTRAIDVQLYDCDFYNSFQIDKFISICAFQFNSRFC